MPESPPGPRMDGAAADDKSSSIWWREGADEEDDECCRETDVRNVSGSASSPATSILCGTVMERLVRSRFISNASCGCMRPPDG